MLSHIYPINDLKPHNLEGFKCACGPRTDGLLVIHNSFYGREIVEAEVDYAEKNTS